MYKEFVFVLWNLEVVGSMKAAETNGTDYVKVVLKMVVKENAMNAKK